MNVSVLLFEDFETLDVFGPVEILGRLTDLYSIHFYSLTGGLTNNKHGVSIQTKKINDKVEILVSDNGNGIPQKAIDKIFQPFFTTKPTGQGTGLGLSLSYDIIKVHGGEIKAETKEGEGTDFFITIPMS